MIKDFELVAHTADLKIRVYGVTLPELFRHAVIGMFQSIGPQAQGCKRVVDRLVCPQLPKHHRVEIVAPDQTSLLVDFLGHAVALSDIYNEAYLDATIHILTETQVQATLHGIKIQGFEMVEIKAVTYHDVQIMQVADGWQVTIVCDI